MKLLVDSGILIASNFLEEDSKQDSLVWNSGIAAFTLSGFKRVKLDKDFEQQKEKNALFTIGRLARAGRISLYSYSELNVETWRGGRGREPLLNALSRCQVMNCPAALERSKFRQTTNIRQWLSKGFKAKGESFVQQDDFSQVSYLNWLAALSTKQVELLINSASAMRLNDFELDSLRELTWFQSLSQALGTPKNLPDCFHIWTARRNGIEIFLTLEKSLPRSIEQIRNRRQNFIDMDVAVVRPTQFLSSIGIADFDLVPVESDRFYTYAEITELDRCLV